MNNLEGFLKKFRLIVGARESERSAVSDVLTSVLGVKLSEDSIVIKNKTISINCSPIIKSQIFLNKSKILAELNKNPGLKNVADIR